MKHAGHANPNVCASCEQWPIGSKAIGLAVQVSVGGTDIVPLEQAVHSSEYIMVKAA
jgi:hypothetical protein